MPALIPNPSLALIPTAPAVLQVSKREQLEGEREATLSALKNDWKVAFDWLAGFGFIGSGTADGAAALTARGRACAAFADGQPLIIGTIISDGWLSQLNLPEVCSWLCLFLQERRLASTAKSEYDLPEPSDALREVRARHSNTSGALATSA